MEKKPRLFVYDRKELAVLIVLGVLVAAFAFTFGIHLGKKVAPSAQQAEEPDHAPAATEADKSPTSQQLAEQGRGANDGATDEIMNQALQDEVQKAGLKLNTPRPTELPEDSKSKNAGGTTHVAGQKLPAAQSSGGGSGHGQTKTESAAPQTPKFTLQVGSYPSVGEAKALQDSLESRGLRPYLKSAAVSGKGTWYRIFLGQFVTQEEAEQFGERYRNEKIIDSYIVANID